MIIRKYRIIFALIFITVVPLYGCLSSRIYPGGIEHSVSKLKNQPYKILGEAEGQTSNFSLLWLVTVTPRADIDRAISEAISNKGGDDLIDVRWWIERKVYIIGTVTIIHVKGKVIKYTGEAAL